MKDIYIVLSQTRSVVSRLIHVATGDAYTHVSIGFEEEPRIMYSFGRLFPRNPLWGGFVRESALFGTMKRFRDADVAVIRVPVSDEKYSAMRGFIASMYSRRRQYGYNYIGLFCAKFGFAYRWRDHYYCSEFVKWMLEHFDVVAADEMPEVMRPVDFLTLRGGELIYSGRLYKFYEAKILRPENM